MEHFYQLKGQIQPYNLVIQKLAYTRSDIDKLVESSNETSWEISHVYFNSIALLILSLSFISGLIVIGIKKCDCKYKHKRVTNPNSKENNPNNIETGKYFKIAGKRIYIDNNEEMVQFT